MISTIQRLVALATYANVTLNGMKESFDLEQLLAHNCYSMEFIERPPMNIPGSSKKIASDAGAWISTLLDSEAKGVLLLFMDTKQHGLPDHITSAFVGGGSHWMVIVKYHDTNHLYSFEGRNSGSLKDQFVLLDREFPNQTSTSTVADSRIRIDNVLESLVDFARSHEHSSHWAAIFENAKRVLNESTPGNPDFIPSGIYSLDSHRLIEAAFQSWVFGGMGSWNDLAFNAADQERYMTLSDDLYKSICTAIIAGVNSLPDLSD